MCFRGESIFVTAPAVSRMLLASKVVKCDSKIVIVSLNLWNTLVWTKLTIVFQTRLNVQTTTFFPFTLTQNSLWQNAVVEVLRRVPTHLETKEMMMGGGFLTAEGCGGEAIALDARYSWTLEQDEGSECSVKGSLKPSSQMLFEHSF